MDQIEHYNNKIKISRFLIPVLEGNSLSVNILLLLGLLTFIVITIDLDTELSVQKDEITQIVATLDKSINTLHLDVLDNSIIKPPLVGLFPLITFLKSDNDVVTLPEGRAPPLAA